MEINTVKHELKEVKTIVKKWTIEDTGKVKARKVKSKSDIKKGDRLFYELGYNKVVGKIVTKTEIIEELEWVRSDKFKEIHNIEEFLKDPRFDEDGFIEHHNFVILEK